MDKKFKATLIILFILIICAWWFYSIDLSDPSKENIVSGKISKQMALEIGFKYMGVTKIYAYSANQVYINTTTEGKEIHDYVWSVGLYVKPHFFRYTKCYWLYIDIETGEIIAVSIGMSA
jgi:hypothetical protein